MESQLPIEAIDSAEPMLATEPNDPMLPMDSTEPFEQIDRSESSDHSDHLDDTGRVARVMGSSSLVHASSGQRSAPSGCLWTTVSRAA